MKNVNPDLQAALDQRLNDALATANYRITLNTQKKNAKLKLQSALTLAMNGGTFAVDHQLISFVSALLQHGKEEAVLLDVNGNPIEITDLPAFSEKIIDLYYSAVNDYFLEIRALNKSRTPKALVGEQ